MIYKNLNIRKVSILSGISLLIMAIAAFFSYGYVHSNLVLMEDGFKTFQNINNQHFLFNMGIMGWIIILITDLLVSWGLYVVLYKTNMKISFTAMIMRLIYTIFLGVAIFQLLLSSQMVTSITQNSSLGTESLMIHLTRFDQIWSLGLMIFGLHLLLVGYLALQTKSVPKLISVLLTLAGMSYMLVHFMNNFTTADDLKNTIETVLMLPMFLGELSFAIWLLKKGGKNKQFV